MVPSILFMFGPLTLGLVMRNIEVFEVSRCTTGWEGDVTQWVEVAASVGQGECMSIIYLSNIFWIKFKRQARVFVS